MAWRSKVENVRLMQGPLSPPNWNSLWELFPFSYSWSMSLDHTEDQWPMWEREINESCGILYKGRHLYISKIINNSHLPKHLEVNRPLQFRYSISFYLVLSICQALIHNWIIYNPSTQKLNLAGEMYTYIKNIFGPSSQWPLTLKIEKVI